MKRLFGLLLLTVWAPMALAIAPYIAGDKVSAGDVPNVVEQVEKN